MPGAAARSWAPWVISAALAAALVALAITKLNIASAVRALADVGPGWIVLALALMCGSFMARAESWFAAIRAAAPGQVVSRSAVRRGLLIGMATSTVAPARLGEAARAWIISRRLGDSRQTLALVVGTVLSQTLLNLLALSILATIAIGGSHLGRGRVGGVIAAIAIPALVVLALALGPRLLRPGDGSGGSRAARVAAWLYRQLVQLRAGFAVLRRRRSALHTSAAQLSGWALQLGTCYAVMLALHLHPHATVAAAAAVLLAVNVTAVVPATPSNVGVFQAACIAVLARFGVGASTGLAYGILLQAVEIVSALGLGVPALLREGVSWRELRDQIEEERRGPQEGGAS